MGKTKGEKWITGSDQMLDVVLEFIEKVIPNQHFVLAGESYGGYLARAIVLKKRNLVDGLLLICPAIVSEREKRRVPEHRILLQDPEFLSTLGRSELADFKSGHVVLTRRVWERYSKEVLSGLKIADYEFLKKLEKNREFSFDLEARAKPFDKPSLLFAGRQDTSVGYHDAWSIIDKYPRMTYIALDKASHDLQIEQERVFNILISEWLDRVEEFTP